MNIFTDPLGLSLNGIKLFFLAVQTLVVIGITIYSLLYIFYAPHVSNKHMGINHPKYIMGTVKTGLLIALATGISAIFVFATGRL